MHRGDVFILGLIFILIPREFWACQDSHTSRFAVVCSKAQRLHEQLDIAWKQQLFTVKQKNYQARWCKECVQRFTALGSFILQHHIHILKEIQRNWLEAQSLEEYSYIEQDYQASMHFYQGLLQARIQPHWRVAGIQSGSYQEYQQQYEQRRKQDPEFSKHFPLLMVLESVELPRPVPIRPNLPRSGAVTPPPE
jgi:hypothetical protein